MTCRVRWVVGAALAAFFMAAIPASAGPDYWGCHQRQADGQCIVTVSIGNNFAAVDQQVIREVFADFSLSPNIEAVEVQGGNADVVMVRGNDGFWTDLQTRKVHIDRAWSYANYCCDSHDGMRGIYCHELMHGIANARDTDVRTQPSCFNGTSPYLGVEDFAQIALTYPLP